MWVPERASVDKVAYRQANLPHGIRMTIVHHVHFWFWENMLRHFVDYVLCLTYLSSLYGVFLNWGIDHPNDNEQRDRRNSKKKKRDSLFLQRCRFLQIWEKGVFKMACESREEQKCQMRKDKCAVSWGGGVRLQNNIKTKFRNIHYEEIKQIFSGYGQRTGNIRMISKETIYKNTNHQQMRKESIIINRNTLLHVLPLMGHLQGNFFVIVTLRLRFTIEWECAVDCALRCFWRCELSAVCWVRMCCCLCTALFLEAWTLRSVEWECAVDCVLHCFWRRECSAVPACLQYTVNSMFSLNYKVQP
jgi:hypothetical protein